MTNRVSWLGHATCRIELGELRAITDPVLSHRLGHLVRWERLDRSLARGLDVVLLSHAHHDHLHPRSLRWLARNVDQKMRVLAPAGTAARVAERVVGEVTPVRPGDRFTIDGVDIEVVRADHQGGRWREREADPAAAEAVGYILRGEVSVYFAGDTELFDGMSAFGPVDVALLPIGGWWKTLGTGHMNAERAAQAARLVQTSVVVPIHWNTFRPVFTRSTYGDERYAPGKELERALTDDRDIAVRMIDFGEWLDIEPASDSTARST